LIKKSESGIYNSSKVQIYRILDVLFLVVKKITTKLRKIFFKFRNAHYRLPEYRQVVIYYFETNTGGIHKPNCGGGGGNPRKEFKKCSKNGALCDIFRVCFTQFLCGYPVLIKTTISR
jgi:hypothetical protein